jgi:hypothetical protein
LARAAALLFPIQEPRPSTTAGGPRHHGRYLDAASSTTVSHMVVARTTIMAIRM